MTLETKTYEGEVGNRGHITCSQKGTVPTSAIAHLMGARGEVPGEHRNKHGAEWEAFKADIAERGILEPIFITVDYGEDPVISEGNHRRDAAVENQMPEVPVEIRYFGHAEQISRIAASSAPIEQIRALVESLRGGHWQLGICGRATSEVEKRFGYPKVTGFYEGPDASGRPVWIPHAWNVLPNGDVLDPTCDQFGFEMVRVVPRADARAYKPFTPAQERALKEFRREEGREPGAEDWPFLMMEGAKGGVYYHASPTSNRASIEQHGLRAGEHGVWLWSDPERVRGLTRAWVPFHGHEAVDWDIWEVRAEEVVHGTEARDQLSRGEWEEGDSAYVSYRDIPSSRVRRVDNQTLAMKTGAGDHSEHVMICLRPSEATRKVFADMDECTEDVDELHITLYYLGTTEDCGGLMGKERLYRGIYDFAIHAGYRGLTGKVNGWGTFLNGDEGNVVIALWDIPGIAEFRYHLMRYVKDHGVEPRQENHGFTPHMSIDWPQDPPERLPSLPEGNPEKEHFVSVWLVWGEEWTEIMLS